MSSAYDNGGSRRDCARSWADGVQHVTPSARRAQNIRRRDDGAWGRPREPPTASRCLGGVGVGMSADRTTAALTSERTAEPLLPLLAAARALTLEMWIRPSAADLREERLAPIFALHSPSAATIGSCGQHDEASLVVSQSSIGGRPVLKVQLAQAWFSSFTNVHRCLEFTVVDGDSGGWRGGAARWAGRRRLPRVGRRLETRCDYR